MTSSTPPIAPGASWEFFAEQMKAARQEVDKAIARVGVIGERDEMSYDKLDRAINSEIQRSSRWTLYQVAVIGGFIGGLVVYMLFRFGIIR